MKDSDELQTIFIYIADHNWPKKIYYAPYYQPNQGTMVIIGIKYDFISHVFLWKKSM